MKNCNGYKMFIAGKEICLPVYYVMPPWWKWVDYKEIVETDPEPQPWRLTSPKEIIEVNRHLHSLIEQELIDKEALIDKVNLFHIKQISKNLSPKLSETLGKTIEELESKIIEKTIINF